MKRNLNILLSLFVLASMVLAACGGAAATEAPAVTEPAAPAATDAPAPVATEPPAPSFSGTVTVTFVQEPDNLNPMYTDMYFAGILREFYLKPAWSFDENASPVPVLVTEIPSAD